MKDIGYYAGFLSVLEQESITKASAWQLADLMNDIVSDIYDNYSSGDDPTAPQIEYPIEVGWVNLSDRDLLALIRGLCDRIELKLMEVAK